jgi:hypothetical protein
VIAAERVIQSDCMATAIDVRDVRRYAVLGAEARLAQIAEEAASIYRAFPELRGRQALRTPASEADSEESGRPMRRRRGKRKRMSAAQRKAVGERMKKYWEARRAAKLKKEGPAATTRTRKTR